MMRGKEKVTQNEIVRKMANLCTQIEGKHKWGMILKKKKSIWMTLGFVFLNK